jgi:hypothetical protein
LHVEPEKLKKIKKFLLAFEVLTAAITKIITFQNVMPFSLIKVQRGSGGTYCLHPQGLAKQTTSQQASSRLYPSGCMFGLLFDTEYGGNMFLRNVGKVLPNYMASDPRR